MKKIVIVSVFLVVCISIGGYLLLGTKNKCNSPEDINGVDCDLVTVLKNNAIKDFSFKTTINSNDSDEFEYEYKDENGVLHKENNQKESNNDLLNPIPGGHYIIQDPFDDALIFFDKNMIDNVKVYSVKIVGNDIIIKGSGFLKLNRGVEIEGNTCNVYPSQSTSDTEITLKNSVNCLPNDKKYYLSIRHNDYKGEQHKQDSFIKLYENLGGTEKLENVITANRFLISK